MAKIDNSIAQRHAGFHTPEKTIFDLVIEHTGYTPLQRTKIAKGYDSEVYDVATREGSSLIVKIKHYGGISYQQEAWAIEMYRNVGVPVPQIYASGSRKIAGQEREYMVQERMSGQPLDERLAVLSSLQINHALRNAGEVLRQIHQVKAGGFYRRNPDTTWGFPSWKSLGDSDVINRAKESGLLVQAGFSRREVESMLHHLKKYWDAFTCEQPVLCHGDYLPDHIFLDEDLHICAIIDFGMIEGHHPIHDLANFSFAFPSLPLQALLESYGDHEMFHERFLERLLLHKLSLQMGHLAYALREDLKPEAAIYTEQLKASLRQL